MPNEEKHICPKCGIEMLEAKFDGSFTLDGSINFDGYYCPVCSKQNDSSEKDN